MIPDPKYTEPQKTIVLPLNYSDSIKLYEDKPNSDIWRAFNGGHEAALNYIYRTNASATFQFGAQISKNRDVIQGYIQNILIDLRRKMVALARCGASRLLVENLAPGIDKEDQP